MSRCLYLAASAALAAFAVLGLAVKAVAQLSTVARDNGTYSSRYTATSRSLWEETAMLQPRGPAKIEKIYVYLYGTAAATDTLWLMGDASEGFTPPSHYVWKYDLLTEPIVFNFTKTGWDTIDISDRNVRSDGYDRIVMMHRLKTGAPAVGYDRGGAATPYTSFLYDPWTPNPDFYNIPGILYLANGDFMMRLGVRYDFPVGDSSAAPPAPTLVDVTRAAGIVTSTGDTVKADRVSIADWNGDGYDDINIGSLYFENKKDGTFKDVSAQINVPCASTAWADFDNDGKIDLYAINGGTGDKLMKNNGDGTFSDVTAASGYSNPNPTVCPIWFDYDHDGYVDLYVANGRVETSSGETYYPDAIWHNNRNGTFTNVTDVSGISDAEPAPYDDCWGGAVCDYNGDRWPDIFVANYRLAPDFLFKNQHDGTFENVGAETGVQGDETDDPNYFGHGIGADWGDFNNDGLIDLAVGNLGHPDERGSVSNPSLIYRNNGGPDYHFTSVGYDMGLKFREMNAGIVWADMNNDGYLDLWHCQYSYVDPYTDQGGLVEQYRPSRLYLNEGPGKNFHLQDITWQVGSLIHGAWTAARADFDHDGKMDLVVASSKTGSGVKLFKNNITPSGNWLEIRVHGSPEHQVPMDGYGTSITVYAGALHLYRELMGGGGGATSSQNSSLYHFGLGAAQTADSVIVRYPNGESRRMFGVAANQYFEVAYDETKNRVKEESSSHAFFTIDGRAVTVVSSVAQVEVIDALGRTLLSSSQGSFEIPLSVARGVYFLRILDRSGVAHTEKILLD
jgi:hypothetical protein